MPTLLQSLPPLLDDGAGRRPRTWVTVTPGWGVPTPARRHCGFLPRAV